MMPSFRLTWFPWKQESAVLAPVQNAAALQQHRRCPGDSVPQTRHRLSSRTQVCSEAVCGSLWLRPTVAVFSPTLPALNYISFSPLMSLKRRTQKTQMSGLVLDIRLVKRDIIRGRIQ